MSDLDDSDPSISLMNESYITLDPTILCGFELKASRKLRLKYISESHENTIIRNSTIRIFEMFNGFELSEVRFEIFSDETLFFYAECNVNEEEFSLIRRKNGFNFSFGKFSESILELIDKASKNQNVYDITFTVDPKNEHHQLKITQKTKLKVFDVFIMDLISSSEDFIHTQIQYRFNILKMETTSKMKEVQQMYEQLRSINPQSAGVLKKTIELEILKMRHAKII